MFEKVTYEMILKRMLEKAQEHNPGLDTREGSVLYTALAPSAVELQNMYIELDFCLDQFFADTQAREYLVRRCSDRGVIPYQAVRAIMKGEFNLEIPLGARFTLDTQNYKAIERISDGVYRMECESEGEEGSRHLGTLVPIEYIPGLTKAELTEVLIPGEEEEETEHLRSRYLTAVRKPSTSGNRYDYYNWAMECNGVGAVKVFPLSEGPGTVKIVVTDPDKHGASQSLIEAVSDHIELLRPIGATVSVVSAVEKQIQVSAKIKLKNGINLGSAQGQFAAIFGEFLEQYALQASYVSLARVGNLLLDVAGIEDYGELKLNGAASNVVLTEIQTPVPGSVTLEVM